MVDRSPGPPWNVAHVPSARCCERIQLAVPRAVVGRADAEELAQQQVLGVHRDVGLAARPSTSRRGAGVDEGDRAGRARAIGRPGLGSASRRPRSASCRGRAVHRGHRSGRRRSGRARPAPPAAGGSSGAASRAARAAASCALGQLVGDLPAAGGLDRARRPGPRPPRRGSAVAEQPGQLVGRGTSAASASDDGQRLLASPAGRCRTGLPVTAGVAPDPEQVVDGLERQAELERRTRRGRRPCSASAPASTAPERAAHASRAPVLSAAIVQALVHASRRSRLSKAMSSAWPSIMAATAGQARPTAWRAGRPALEQHLEGQGVRGRRRPGWPAPTPNRAHTVGRWRRSRSPSMMSSWISEKLCTSSIGDGARARPTVGVGADGLRRQHGERGPHALAAAAVAGRPSRSTHPRWYSAAPQVGVQAGDGRRAAPGSTSVCARVEHRRARSSITPAPPEIVASVRGARATARPRRRGRCARRPPWWPASRCRSRLRPGTGREAVAVPGRRAGRARAGPGTWPCARGSRRRRRRWPGRRPGTGEPARASAIGDELVGRGGRAIRRPPTATRRGTGRRSSPALAVRSNTNCTGEPTRRDERLVGDPPVVAPGGR